MSETRVKAILDYLRKSLPKDLSIEELAKATGIGRDTVSKYVYSLEKEGKIKLTPEVISTPSSTRSKKARAQVLEAMAADPARRLDRRSPEEA